MPHKIIKAAPNAVYYKNEMKTNHDLDSINNIIFVGRLIEEKKPMFLVKAFHKSLENLPKETKLLIVGEGEQKPKIESYINGNNLSNRINIFGHISEYNLLKKLYFTSLLSVSPGYVGLSITQSFSFGVPMLISKDERHSPEIEAAIENKNSVFYETDNVESFSKQIIMFFKNKIEWISRRDQIVNHCKDNYSIESMSSAFSELLQRNNNFA